MRVNGIKVQNYRGLQDIGIPLSSFACLIGRNNAGKSSFLQCISLLRSGTKLREIDFYDPGEDIRIELDIDSIGEADLARIADEEHRRRLSALVEDGRIRLVRKYAAEDGKTGLFVVRDVPKDPRFGKAHLQEIMRGKRAGELRSVVVEEVPELADALEQSPTQAKVQDALADFVRQLDARELIESDETLPTGLDRSIMPMLPDVIYIPAVKDVNDEIKTTESATFGKLLRILFDQIEDEFGDIEEKFADLQRKLSRVLVEGEEVDDRLEPVKVIEETIERFVQHNFPDVKLKIEVPAPELRAILSTAEITVDDGYEGPITSKGDGLKRAVAFAVLQAYAEIRGKPEDDGRPTAGVRHPYILLFEEPELYLHPAAQAQLFTALEAFAQEHTVVVTTHNPAFFSADSTKTFVKLRKVPVEGKSPVAEAFHIDLVDMGAREQLQLIGYENNNVALFYDRVVLVEGDSDLMVFPHLVKILFPTLEIARQGVEFVRISGKGSLSRYRGFFGRCGIEVASISDLDVLTNQFEKLGVGNPASEKRSQLMAALDAVPADEPPAASSVRDVSASGDTRGLWAQCRSANERWTADRSQENLDALQTAVDRFTDRLEGPARYVALKKADAATGVGLLKNELIELLRGEGRCVLSRGCLEDYFPDHLSKGDKVERALAFCKEVEGLEALESACPELQELKVILECCLGLEAAA